jgi:hypothetical protein
MRGRESTNNEDTTMNDHPPAITLPISLLFLALAVYMAPTLVAGARGHRDHVVILVVNLLLGWTFVFWVATLAWSLFVPARR